jgi:hypothetical protein
VITADTITDEQIRELRMRLVEENERRASPDWQIVNTCTVALWAPMSTSDHMFLLQPYRAQRQKADQQRAEARARCAEILNARGAK